MRSHGSIPGYVSPTRMPRLARKGGKLDASLAVLVSAALAFGCGEGATTGLDTTVAEGSPVAEATRNGRPVRAGVLTRVTDFPGVTVCPGFAPVTLSIFEAGTEFEPVIPEGAESSLGAPPSKETGVLRFTYVNPENEKSVVFQIAGSAVRKATSPVRTEEIGGIERRVFDAVQIQHGVAKLSGGSDRPIEMDRGTIIIHLLVADEPGFPVVAPPTFEIVGGSRPLSQDPSLFCQLVVEELDLQPVASP